MTSPDFEAPSALAKEERATGYLPDRGIMSMYPHRVIGIVGLGRMGTAFARNLIADGHRVLVYDRDLARVAAVRADGGEGAADLAGLAACDSVLTSLPDDDVLKAVTLGGLVGSMRPGAVLTTPLIFSIPHLAPIRADSLPDPGLF